RNHSSEPHVGDEQSPASPVVTKALRLPWHHVAGCRWGQSCSNGELESRKKSPFNRWPYVRSTPWVSSITQENVKAMRCRELLHIVARVQVIRPRCRSA